MSDPRHDLDDDRMRGEHKLPVSDKKRLAMLRMALPAVISMYPGKLYERGHTCGSEPPERPCLNCGKMKQHNNSFCSAECCREWKGKA